MRSFANILRVPLQLRLTKRNSHGALGLTNFATKVKIFPEKFKGTIIEKWAEYWKQLCLDYFEVFQEVVKGARSKPINALALLSGLGGVTYTAYCNPDETSFRDCLLNYSNLLIFTPPSLRNPAAMEHLKSLETSYNRGTVRRFSFLIFSVMWEDNYDERVALYKATCSYLKPQYLKLHERVLDVGFLNKWWILDKRMLDYDVNPNHWNSK